MRSSRLGEARQHPGGQGLRGQVARRDEGDAAPVRGGTAQRLSGARPPSRALAALCVTEVVSWGVLYYAFPVALASISADTGWSATAATAAFSGGLVVSALAGIPVGRWLDRHGPRRVMTAGSLLAVPATVGIALAPTLLWFFAAWLVAGVAMAAVFYQAAFAALTRWYGPARVRALTVLTLVAGLASTVFAPLTSVLLEHLDWRDTYLVLAGVLLVVTVPLHATALTLPWAPAHDAVAQDDAVGSEGPVDDAGVRSVMRTPAFWLLSGALTITAFGLYATSVTLLIPLLTERGMSASLAATTLGLLGAGQLLGRLGYAPLSARTGPRRRAVLVVLASAAVIGLLAAVPGPAGALIAVAVLVGAVRGVGTLLQATVVAERWGTARYASLAGAFAAPITAASALAPFGGAALVDVVGSRTGALAVLSGLVLLAAAAAARVMTPDPRSPVLDPGRRTRG
jgi:MFS family permease